MGGVHDVGDPLLDEVALRNPLPAAPAPAGHALASGRTQLIEEFTPDQAQYAIDNLSQ